MDRSRTCVRKTAISEEMAWPCGFPVSGLQRNLQERARGPIASSPHPQAGAWPDCSNSGAEMAVTLRARRHTGTPFWGRRPRAPLMEKFVIEGGVPLSGTLVPAGNKNAALPILASALLTEDEVTVANVPRIRDVEAMLEILSAIGVQVAWRGPNEVTLC